MRCPWFDRRRLGNKQCAGQRHDDCGHHVPSGRDRIARPADQQRFEKLRRSAENGDRQRVHHAGRPSPDSRGQRLNEEEHRRRRPKNMKQREDSGRPEQRRSRPELIEKIEHRQNQHDQEQPGNDQDALGTEPVGEPPAAKIPEDTDHPEHDRRSKGGRNRHVQRRFRISRQIFERVVADRRPGDDEQSRGRDQDERPAGPLASLCPAAGRKGFDQGTAEAKPERDDRRTDEEGNAPAPRIQLRACKHGREAKADEPGDQHGKVGGREVDRDVKAAAMARRRLHQEGDVRPDFAAKGKSLQQTEEHGY